MKTALLAILLTTTAHAAPPNMLIILVDDLGWGDVPAHGGAWDTPNIGRLFAEGCELSRMYAHPTCIPSRAELLTGVSSALRGVSGWKTWSLPAGDETIAEALASVLPPP